MHLFILTKENIDSSVHCLLRFDRYLRIRKWIFLSFLIFLTKCVVRIRYVFQQISTNTRSIFPLHYFSICDCNYLTMCTNTEYWYLGINAKQWFLMLSNFFFSYNWWWESLSQNSNRVVLIMGLWVYFEIGKKLDKFLIRLVHMWSKAYMAALTV